MKKCLVLLKTIGTSALLLVAPPIFAAAPYTNVTEVLPTDPIDSQFYGWSVAISDDIAVVGAPVSFSPFFRPPPLDGAAYVYAKTDSGWVLEQKLMASDGAATNTGFGNEFGFAVSVSGNTIVVGAPTRRVGTNFGAVYVFKRTGDAETPWTEQAILTTGTSRPFGISVAVRGGTLVAGGLEDRLSVGGVSDAGLAFVFKRSGDEWVEDGNLMSTDIPPRNRFGASVDIKGNTVVIGAQSQVSDPASVYVFSRQGGSWSQDTKLSPENNSTTFGQSVSLSGASIAVGDPNSGTVSIYEHCGHNWELAQTVNNSSSQFGYSVSLREDSLLVGARLATVGTVQSGAAYLYKFDQDTGTWTLDQTLAPPDGQNGDSFGDAVSLSSTAAMVGAPRHFHSPGPISGSAYIFEP